MRRLTSGFLVSMLAATSLSAATYTVTNTADSGAGSLRQAIIDANGTPGVADTIAFNIPGAGAHTITPASPLPTITDARDDRRLHAARLERQHERPGPARQLRPPHRARRHQLRRGNGQRRSALQGNFAFVVRGLVINRAPSSAIQVITANGVVEGCFLGVDPTGVIGRSNNLGVLVESATNVRIGGQLPAERNVIAANAATQLGYGCLSGRRNGSLDRRQFHRCRRDRRGGPRPTGRETRPASPSASGRPT